MCLGAVLMFLSTFRMDNFLRSTLPGNIATEFLLLNFDGLILDVQRGVMMQRSMPRPEAAQCSSFPTYLKRRKRNRFVLHCASTHAGRIHLSARRSVEQLPFADTAFLSGNQSTPRRLIEPFRGHPFTTAKTKPQSEGAGNAGQGDADSKAATQLQQPEDVPGASGKPEKPAKESSTEGKTSGRLPSQHTTGTIHP